MQKITVRDTVMVVDDDREFLDELAGLLRLSGYEVVDVDDALRVQELAARRNPSVILLDLKMKRMDGFEVAEELRRFSATMRIPVVAMTGFFIEKEHQSLMALCGIRRCIKKPFNPLDVIAAVETSLRESSATIRPSG